MQKQSKIPDKVNIVIYAAPIGVARSLLKQSELAGDSKRKTRGSMSCEGYKAILYYLEHVKKVNVKEIIKSCI